MCFLPLKFIKNKGGKKYYITFINDSIKYYYIYLLRNKDKTLKMFKNYKNEIKNRHNKKINVIRNNKAREYEVYFW